MSAPAAPVGGTPAAVSGQASACGHRPAWMDTKHQAVCGMPAAASVQPLNSLAPAGCCRAPFRAWSLSSSLACLQLPLSCLQIKCLSFADSVLTAALLAPDAAMLAFTWYILVLQEIGSRADSAGAQCLCFSPCSAPGAVKLGPGTQLACTCSSILKSSQKPGLTRLPCPPCSSRGAANLGEQAGSPGAGVCLPAQYPMR